MLDARLNVYEYEDILIGSRKKIEYRCSFSGTSAEKCKEVGNIWNYAITKLLRWDAKTAQKYLTPEIVKKLRLDTTFSALGYSPKDNYIKDYSFALQYAFPGEIRYSKIDETLDIYKSSLEQWNKGKNSNPTYPKKFFLGFEGQERLSYIINYYIREFFSDMSTEELYDMFADKKNMLKWFKKKGLAVPLKTFYSGDTLDCLHLADNPRHHDVFYYYLNKIDQAISDKEIAANI